MTRLNRLATTLLFGAMGCATTLHTVEANQPPSGAVLNGDLVQKWNFTSGAYTVTNDAALSKPVLIAGKGGIVLESKEPLTGRYEVGALVRLRTDLQGNASAVLHIARTNDADNGIYIVLTASQLHDTIACAVYERGKHLHDLAALSEKLDWAAPNANNFSYKLRAYDKIQPGWTEEYRICIEHDMASLPDHNAKWLDVRVEARPGQVRFWVDDRLVATKSDPSLMTDGIAKVRVDEGVQLAVCELRALPSAEKGFLPIPLAGYANARSFLGNASVSFQQPGPLTVEGVPFILPGVNPEGNDHIDVGSSLFRQANAEHYFPSYGERWAGAAWRDPARIQLRVPNGQYDSLYLVAAADDERESVPLVTAMFYRPSAGFAERFAARVPLASAKSSDAQPLPVRLANGRSANLWLVRIPLDPGKLSSFADLDIIEFELTKEVHRYRSYPDPYIYGWHQAGRPSSVHIFAATLGEVPVGFDWKPDQFGHVWTAPAVPSYTARLTNHLDAAVTGKLTVATSSYDGSEKTTQEKPVTLVKGQAFNVPFSVPVKLNGHHDIVATLEIAGRTWAEKRTLVRLAPDTRSPKWTEGKGALFGFWSYAGGHYTPAQDHHFNLMIAAGARTAIGIGAGTNAMVQKHFSAIQAGAWEVSPQPWARENPYDPAKYAAYKQEVIEKFTKAREAIPPQFRPDHVYFYPEPHVSTRLTAGNYPEYWNGEPYEYTEEEKASLCMFMVTSQCAAEAIRAKWPELKILIPWGDPLFIVPLLRAGFPKNLIDGSGLDICGFERIPEQQLHQISVHRLYQLRKEYEKYGMPKPQLQYTEGIFVPTEVGACSYREQMDIYHRWALISMAYGIDRFYSGWFAFDCGSYYGSEHYGGCGIQRRIPYCDPKPAYAAYATMTDKLNEANFDGWLPTGSLTTYCLRFKGPKGSVYALWTLRGKRTVTFRLPADAEVGVTDSMNNTTLLKSVNKEVTFETGPSVVYVTGAGDVVVAGVGEPDHSDVAPPSDAKQVADLGDGTWKYTSERNEIYENNNFDTFRYAGKFSAMTQNNPARGNVLVSKLEKQDIVRELMPWYNTLTPRKPIELPGVPSHLGLWVKGASDWGRVVYRVRDAKGEVWISIGTKDQWNCDDVHSWSNFNFDGWRYVRFELPGHTGWDNFRKHGATWWRSEGGDQIVDQPLRLEQIIVEQRSHILYVNDVQPAPSDTVSFGKLYVEYAETDDASTEAVRVSKLRMSLPKGTPDLPNPIAELQRDGVGAPTKLVKLTDPEHYYDGTRMHVHFEEMPGAKAYHLWVGAYPDGRGAVNLVPAGIKNGALVTGLRPGIKLYYWITYTDAQDKPSKPSRVHEEVTVDKFKEK